MSHSEKPQSVYGSGNTAGYVYTTEWNTGSRMQIATLTYPSSDHGVQLMRLEESPGGPWGDWRVLGAPERGSNANGEYVKFADGTMICTHFLSLSSSADVTWNFPASFASSSSLSWSCAPQTTSVAFGRVSTGGVASLSAGAFDNSGSRVGPNARLMAVGRWF